MVEWCDINVRRHTQSAVGSVLRPVRGGSEIHPPPVLVSEYWHRIPAVCVSRIFCVSE
jgi:hypothetical protein